MTLLPAEKLEAFRVFLRQRGAEILPSTNEYEVLRFRTIGAVGVSVLYRKRSGGQTATGETERALSAFFGRGRWTPGVVAPQKPRRALSHRIEMLRRRDGDACFYCGAELSFEDRDAFVIEHLCPRSLGGPDHVSNLALAHRLCEVGAGALSVAEKVRLRDRMRAPIPAPGLEGEEACPTK